MCNAYGLRAPLHRIADTFRELRIPLVFPNGVAPNLEPRDMIRPTEAAAVVRPQAGGAEGSRAELTPMRWGFAPPRPRAAPVINFRSEGRSFAASGRALALASHFFEYTGAKSPKTRWRFTKRGEGGAHGEGADGEDENPFAIAGWVRPTAGPEGARTSAGDPWPESFTLLTVEPGPDVAPFHDRQVVILERRNWASWLFGAADVAGRLLAPSPAGSLRVSRDA